MFTPKVAFYKKIVHVQRSSSILSIYTEKNENQPVAFIEKFLLNVR
jgi:hypothetical protein